MSQSDAFEKAFENTFSVLALKNARQLLSGTLKIEKNALLGFAAETAYICLLMLAGFGLAALLVLLKRL